MKKVDKDRDMTEEVMIEGKTDLHMKEVFYTCKIIDVHSCTQVETDHPVIAMNTETDMTIDSVTEETEDMIDLLETDMEVVDTVIDMVVVVIDMEEDTGYLSKFNAHASLTNNLRREDREPLDDRERPRLNLAPRTKPLEFYSLSQCSLIFNNHIVSKN